MCSLLVLTYRKNLGPGSRVGLVLYSTVSVSRGMEIPHGIDKWRFDFSFDRVFLFTSWEADSLKFSGRTFWITSGMTPRATDTTPLMLRQASPLKASP